MSRTVAHCLPDYRIEVRDIAELEEPEKGLRVAVIWLLRGTYGGVPTYGPITTRPSTCLGLATSSWPRTAGCCASSAWSTSWRS